MLNEAIKLAVDAHAGVLDKAGQPYIYHSLRVMLAVQHLGVEHAVVAVLHDVVEDTPISLQDLIWAGYPPSVVDGIDSVTKRPGAETYRDFCIRSFQHPIGRDVKHADIRDNLERLSGLPDENERTGLERRYRWALRLHDYMKSGMVLWPHTCANGKKKPYPSEVCDACNPIERSPG